MTDSSTIAIRTATADDDAVLRDLSALDAVTPLRRPALLAVVDGRAVAAVSLHDGRIAADPFVPTAGVVALLRARTGAPKPVRWRRHGLRRLRPAF